MSGAIGFIASCLATIAAPILFPALRLFFFAPFIVSIIQKRELSFCLWTAFSCGFLLDTLASGTRLGLISLDFTLSTLLIYQLKRYFFCDHLNTFPLLTFAFASTATCLQAFLEAFFHHVNTFNLNWIFSDLILMPALDALFAFLLLIVMQSLKMARAGRNS